MCAAYAQTVYQQCASVAVNWPAGQSPFGGANTISSAYADQTAFCDEFCAPPLLGIYCFRYAGYTD